MSVLIIMPKYKMGKVMFIVFILFVPMFYIVTILEGGE